MDPIVIKIIQDWESLKAWARTATERTATAEERNRASELLNLWRQRHDATARDLETPKPLEPSKVEQNGC